jgi:hypothetical protein
LTSGAVANDRRSLWQLLVEFNYGIITADNISHLKVAFHDGAQFRQKKGRSIDEWAAEVQNASAVLTSNDGHAITESEKTWYFENASFARICNSLILPARTETFEQLIDCDCT